MRRSLLVQVVWAAVVVGTALPAHLAAQGTSGGEWRSYSGDNAGSKYSPLDQIGPSNVQQSNGRPLC